MEGIVAIWQTILQRPDIPDDEKALIGPLDKFTKYGRVPCKLLLNIIIVGLLTAEVIFYVPIDNEYHNDAVLALADKFTPDGQGSFEPELKFHFYDTKVCFFFIMKCTLLPPSINNSNINQQEITNFLLECFDYWDALTQDPTALFIHPTTSSGERRMPFIQTVLKTNGTFKDLITDRQVEFETVTFDCTLSRDNKLGPFNGSDLVNSKKPRESAESDLNVFSDRFRTPSSGTKSRMSKTEIRRMKNKVKTDSSRNSNTAKEKKSRRRLRRKPKPSSYLSNDQIRLNEDSKCSGIPDVYNKVTSFSVMYVVFNTVLVWL